MRQAIVTKYLGPTDFRGSRVKASCQAGSMTVSWDDALGTDENHTTAAKALASKLGWHGTWHGGGLPDGSGQCYVVADVCEQPDRDVFHIPRPDGDRWTVEPGRTLAKDGVPLVNLSRIEAKPCEANNYATGGYTLRPSDADDLTHTIVRLLNEGGAL